MKAICTYNADHDEFYTVATILEEWRVDHTGSHLETMECLEVHHHPDPQNDWHCAICGATAEVLL